MPRSCTICSHPHRADLEKALRDEQPLRDIARQYGVSKDGLARHKTSHMLVAVKRDTVPTPAPAASRGSATGRPQGVRIPDAIRDDVQRVFLEEFQAHGIVSRAAAFAGVDTSTVRWWSEHDEAFGFAYHQAREIVNDLYRDEARRRAVEGTDSYVVSQGRVVYVENDQHQMVPLVEKKFSDALLMFVMKSRMREEFGEQSKVDVTSNGQTVGQLNLDQLTTLMTALPADLAQWRRERFSHDDDRNTP